MINVHLLLEGKKHSVGKLLKTDQDIYFQYEKAFLKTGYELSPFILPLKINATTFKHH